MLTRIPPGYIRCLVNCFITWLIEYKYPEFWKLAKIVTLNKLRTGVPRCDQIRPISLLTTHSKLFEKIMLERNNMAADVPTLAIYVDYQKAYDKVWHRGLFVKLNKRGIPLGLLKLTYS